MFDIGFTELLLIGVVALLVIGPERLPETIRTAAMWLKRIRRGFNEIKQEVQQELHNDAILQDLRKTGEQLKNEANTIGQDVQKSTAALSSPARDASGSTAAHETPATQSPAEKPAE
ncbi:MAG: twin-arginine translocase subunit TatB [Halioglobus sp.]|nr:twin-arginine translocase subunit TatB [Halioglobus sp.]